MSALFGNQRGLSLVEVMVAAGLVTLVVGLSVTPLMEIKKLEKRVEFQSGIDISHQLALQKARNTEFLKATLAVAPGSAQEQCFSGRGTGCTAYTHLLGGLGIAELPTETMNFTQPNGYSAKSEIFINATCVATSCTTINVRVSTMQTSGAPTDGWVGRALEAVFNVPASSLAGRREIDFTNCSGQVITGVDFGGLRSECLPLTGSSTCNSFTPGGPMNSFGQLGPMTAADCQPPVNQTCVGGMDQFGMINGQSECAPPMACTDPMSAACAGATPVPPACVPNYQPPPSSVCDGQAFTRLDGNACPTSVPQPAVGTNPAMCSSVNCTMAGPVRWPDATLGPCEVVSPSVTSSVGAAGTIQNEKAGFIGTFNATCTDNSPALNTFNMADASSTCAPVLCSGYPATIEWSALGVKSGAAGPGLDAVGPWPCGGSLNRTQVMASAPGTLVTTAAEAGARLTSINSASTATGGTVSATCADPGPAFASRTGILSFGPATCAPTGAVAAPVAGTCSNPPNWYSENGTYPGCAATQAGPTTPHGTTLNFVLAGATCGGTAGVVGSNCSGTATCAADSTWSQTDDCVPPLTPPSSCTNPANWFAMNGTYTDCSVAQAGPTTASGATLNFTLSGAQCGGTGGVRGTTCTGTATCAADGTWSQTDTCVKPPPATQCTHPANWYAKNGVNTACAASGGAGPTDSGNSISYTFSGAMCGGTTGVAGGTCSGSSACQSDGTWVQTDNCVDIVCDVNGTRTANFGGPSSALCTGVSTLGPGTSPLPRAACCSGTHSPNYDGYTTVSTGACNWQCGPGNAPPPTPTPTAPVECRQGHPIVWTGVGTTCGEYFYPPGSPFNYTYHPVGSTWVINAGYGPYGQVYGSLFYRCDIIAGAPIPVVVSQECLDGYPP